MHQVMDIERDNENHAVCDIAVSIEDLNVGQNRIRVTNTKFGHVLDDYQNHCLFVSGIVRRNATDRVSRVPPPSSFIYTILPQGSAQ